MNPTKLMQIEDWPFEIPDDLAWAIGQFNKAHETNDFSAMPEILEQIRANARSVREREENIINEYYVKSGWQQGVPDLEYYYL